MQANLDMDSFKYTVKWTTETCTLTMQCLIQLIANLTINICYFVMLHLYVLAPVGHLHGDHLPRSTFIISNVQGVCVCVCIYIYIYIYI